MNSNAVFKSSLTDDQFFFAQNNLYGMVDSRLPPIPQPRRIYVKSTSNVSRF